MPSSHEPPDRAGGVFVTGSGTEVGKTVVAGLIARDASDSGLSVGVLKPAVSGLDEHAAPGAGLPDHELLRLAARSAQTDDEIAPYRYGPAVSPHLGAELAGKPIERQRLLATAERARDGCEYLVCEGVGGFLVPLRLDYLVRDFAHDLGLPIVIVARPGLGTINHTLLTLEAVRGVGLDVLAVALTPWPAEASEVERSNRATVEQLGNVPVVAVPPIDIAAPDSWPPLDLFA